MNRLLLSLVLACGVAAISAQQAVPTAPAARTASESNGTPEARAVFDRAEVLRLARKYAEAAPLYKQAAEIDPRYAEAHWQYIWNTQLADKDRKAATSRLVAEYTGLAEEEPASPVLHWALGKLADTYLESEQHYLRAVALDPDFARPYQDLALIADFRGENDKQAEYLRKAAELNPQDPSYLFYYASAIKEDDALYRKLSMQVVERFPTHERGAQALYWLAFRETEPAEKTALYERLRRDYPPAKFSWSASGMTGLFDVYQQAAPDQALALAREMAGSSGADAKTWQQILAMQEAVTAARKSLAAGDGAAAVTALDKITPYRYIDQVPFMMLRADARAAAGDRQKAFDELVTAIANEPLPALEAAALRHAEALGKTKTDMVTAMWRVREAKATIAPAFTLLDYYAPGENVSLADYKGRVVLVNFWYPACGPCRGEFPHLQKMAQKYQDRGFEILALNIHPDEDAFVVPYMKNNKFLFRPLKTNADWAKEKYNAVGMPSNYLVDHEGRIMFKPGVINGARAEMVFERQLEQLLDRAAEARATTPSKF